MAKTTKMPGYVQPKPKRKGLSTGAFVGIAVGAVLVIAVIVAIVANLGGDSDGGSASAGEIQAVDWSGQALPKEPEDGGADPAMGLTPPRLEGSDFDGEAVVIDPADGRDKLLVFVAHWCEHCQAEVPDLVAWQQAGKQPDTLDVYGIATGTSPAAPNYPPSAWLEREEWPWPVLVDGPTEGNFQAGTAYGLSSYPYLVVVDDTGVVRARWSGEFPDEEAFTSWLDAALA